MHVCLCNITLFHMGIHCLWNKGHWRQSTEFHPINILLLCELPRCQHGAVQVHILIVMYHTFWTLLFLYPFDSFLLLICFLPLIVHFNKRILCCFKLEGTSGEFPCFVFYQRAQNFDAIFWMGVSECWVKGDDNFPQSTGYAPVNKAQITSPK